ncbi:hypothetical protein Tco_1167123 [Tanacetum coccineum]
MTEEDLQSKYKHQEKAKELQELAILAGKASNKKKRARNILLRLEQSFLHDTIAAQRKFLAEQRSAAIRNKPPTISQLRNQMITYLKHVANKKHAELKSKSFEEIQVLYERYKKQDQTFVAIGTEEDERAIKTMNEKATHKEEENDGINLSMRKLKRKKEQRKEREEDDLKICLHIAPDEDKVIDVESLDHQLPFFDRGHALSGGQRKLTYSRRLRKINTADGQAADLKHKDAKRKICEVSTGTTKVNTASTEISTASFSDATIYAFLSTQPQGSQLVHDVLEAILDDDLNENGSKVDYGTA